MRKYLSYIMFVAICVLTMTSCSQDLDYRKACEEKDFAKAYKIVDLLKEDAAQKKADWKSGPSILNGDYETFKNKQLFDTAQEKAEEAEKYVVLQEALFVLESEGTNGFMRIVAIAKEHDAENWLYQELLDVADKIGDSEMFEKLQELDPNSTAMIPETRTIAGIFGDYFEVEDAKIKLNIDVDEYIIRIIRIKNGMPKIYKNKGFRFECDFLDEKGQILKTESCITPNKETISQTKIGDYISLKLNMYSWDVEACMNSKKFRIYSHLN